MKLQLKELVKNKKVLILIILLFIIGIVVLIFVTKKPSFTIPGAPDIKSEYKIIRVNPLEINKGEFPRVNNDKVIYDADNYFVVYDIKTKKTIKTKNEISDFDIGEEFAAITLKKEWATDKEKAESHISLYDFKNNKITKISDKWYPPNISGNNVFWREDENKTAKYNIFNKSIEYIPVERVGGISNNNILYQGDPNQKLSLYNIDSGNTKIISEDQTSKKGVSLSELYATWIEEGGFLSDKIKFYSIDTGNLKEADIPQRSIIYDIDIYKNIIVYTASKDAYSVSCLYSYNIDNNKETEIFCGGASHPNIYENKIVVERYIDDDIEVLLIEI